MLKDDLVTLIPYSKVFVNKLYQAVDMSRKEISEYETWCNEKYTLQGAELICKWWENQWKDKSAYYFMVFIGDELVGSCGVHGIIPEFRRASIGYWVRSDKSGNGIATRSSKLVLDYAFDVLNINRIYIEVADDNLPSIRVVEKLGAKFEGLMREAQILPKGIVDARLYSILKREWNV